MISRHRHGLRASFLFSIAASAPAAAAPHFVPLGDLPRGEFGSEAHGVASHPLRVVGMSLTSNTEEAFAWDPASLIQGFGAETFVAYGISSDAAKVVGFGGHEDRGEAFVWDEANGIQWLGILSSAGDSTAYAASAGGTAVVGDSYDWDTSRDEAFRWDATHGMQGLGVLPGYTDSAAESVSDDGAVVTGSSYAYDAEYQYHEQAFVWNAASGMQALGFLPGKSLSAGYDVSSDGTTIVGGSSTDAGDIGQAFVWRASTGMQGIGSPTTDSFATSVSGNGSIVVGGCECGPFGAFRAFIWDPVHGMRQLDQVLATEYGVDLTGWTLELATAISDDGTVVVGNGTNPSGNSEAWLVRLPEPAATPALLLGFGLLSALAARRAR